MKLLSAILCTTALAYTASPPGLAQTTTIEVDHVGVPNPIVQITTGVEPVSDSGQLKFQIDGNQASVFPVSYNSAGLVDWVQIVGLSNGTTGKATLEQAGSDKGSPVGGPVALDWNTLSNVTVQMTDVPNGVGTVTAPLIGTLMATRRAGPVILEREYFSRFVSSTDQKISGLRSFVTWRSDCHAIEVTVIVVNDMFDPISTDATGNGPPGDPNNLLHVNPSVDGDIYFKELLIDLSSAQLKIAAECLNNTVIEQDDWSDIESGELVRVPTSHAGSNGYNLLPGRVSIAKHFVIYDDSQLDIADARAVAAMHGYGYAAFGPHSVHERKGYGAQRDYVPRFGSSYVDSAQPSVTGREYAKARADDWYNRVGNSLITPPNPSQNDQYFGLLDSGYYYPFGPANTQAGGGVGLLIRHGYQFARTEWLSSRLITECNLLRHTTGLTNPNTGATVTAADLRAANGGSFPWALGHEYEYKNYNPHFIDTIVFPGTNPPPPFVGLKPLNRSWHSPIPTNVVQASIVQPYDSPATWGPYDSAHVPRYFGQIQALVWGANLGWAKHLLEREAAYVERVLPEGDIDYPTNSLGLDLVFMVKSFSLTETINTLKAPEPGTVPSVNNVAQAGAVGNNFEISWQRGEGHLLNQLAEALRITPDGNRRSELEAWAHEAMQTLDAVLSPTGCGARFGSSNESVNLNYPGDVVKYPSSASCFWVNNSVPNKEGHVRKNFSANQYYYEVFLANGVAGIYESDNVPQVMGLSMLETVRGKRLLYGLCSEMWTIADTRSMDKAGAWTLPSTYVLPTETRVANQANPDIYDYTADSVLLDWVWKEHATPPGGCTNTYLVSGSANERCMHHLRIGLRKAVATNNTSERNKYVDWIQRLADYQVSPPSPLTPSYIDDLSEHIQAKMAGDAEDGTRTFGSHYAGVLGELQHLYL